MCCKTELGTATVVSIENFNISTGINHLGEKWKYIRIYEGSLKGTVGEISQLGNGYIKVNKVWQTGSKIINGIAPSYDVLMFSENETTLNNWRPKKGDKYVLCENSKFWLGNDSNMDGMPAIITVSEILEDDDFKKFNVELVSKKMEKIKNEIQKSTVKKINFIKVPNLFFGELEKENIINETSFAFNPGPTNLQPIKNILYIPRQFGPFLNNEDLFEKQIKLVLGAKVVFVDCWNLYHRFKGEVHCGSVIKRKTIDKNWWGEN